MTAKLKKIIKVYCPIPALILFITALVAGIIHLVCVFSSGFSDFFNFYVSSLVRGILAHISNIVPISLAETLILFIPVLFAVTLVKCTNATNKSNIRGVRYVVSLVSVLSLLYSVFVFTTVAAYNGTPLAEKLGLSEKPVSTAELARAAQYMADGMNAELDTISYNASGSSVMPYSFKRMNKLLLDAYEAASDKYAFIPRLKSRIKEIALSEPLTYTHIAGMYTYYTGEANLNVNFPDYTLPFTAAHELAHQRGIMPENEANFVAFLVCMESEDPYIRYSGYFGMYSYLNSALYSSDPETFNEINKSLDPKIKNEMLAYNRFFKKYKNSVAADISSAVNDTYLKSQGVSAGEKSYGMVVDLAVAYVNRIYEN